MKSRPENEEPILARWERFLDDLTASSKMPEDDAEEESSDARAIAAAILVLAYEIRVHA